MASGSIERTDLYRIFNVVQNTMLSYPKDLIISVLRDVFSQDSYYKFCSDPYGFNLTPSLEDVPLDAGINDDTTTRLYINEAWAFRPIYYPAILVRAGNTDYIPISFSRNKEVIQNETTLVSDGYGNIASFTTPRCIALAGSWDSSFTIDIIDRDILSRDNLASLCALIFADIRYDQFLKAGLLIKKISVGSQSEIDDRQNNKLYKASIVLSTRSEWRREIPIANLCDAISICTDFGNLSVDPPVIAPNLTINTSVELIDQINDL